MAIPLLRSLTRIVTRPSSVIAAFRIQPARGEYLASWIHKQRVTYKRQKFVGLGPQVPRFKLTPWNYQAELYAFCHRFGEDLDHALLQTALTDPSHTLHQQEDSQNRLAELEELVQEADNVELSRHGEEVLARTLDSLIREVYPSLPHDGVSAVIDFLTSDKILNRVAQAMGLKDIIRASEYPPTEKVNVGVMKALVGCVARCRGEEPAARLFVRDFVLVELSGKCLEDIWEISNPMDCLKALLQKEGRPDPEPRLQWSSSQETIYAIYKVGIYSDRKLLGESFGETVPIALELAAQNAIHRWFKLPDSPNPLSFK